MPVGPAGTAPPPSNGRPTGAVNGTLLPPVPTAPPQVVAVPTGNNTYVNRTVIAPNAQITFNNFTTVVANNTLQAVGAIGSVTVPTTPGITRQARAC